MKLWKRYSSEYFAYNVWRLLLLLLFLILNKFLLCENVGSWCCFMLKQSIHFHSFANWKWLKYKQFNLVKICTSQVFQCFKCIFIILNPWEKKPLWFRRIRAWNREFSVSHDKSLLLKKHAKNVPTPKKIPYKRGDIWKVWLCMLNYSFSNKWKVHRISGWW